MKGLNLPNEVAKALLVSALIALGTITVSPFDWVVFVVTLLGALLCWRAFRLGWLIVGGLAAIVAAMAVLAGPFLRAVHPIYAGTNCGLPYRSTLQAEPGGRLSVACLSDPLRPSVFELLVRIDPSRFRRLESDGNAICFPARWIYWKNEQRSAGYVQEAFRMPSLVRSTWLGVRGALEDDDLSLRIEVGEDRGTIRGQYLREVTAHPWNCVDLGHRSQRSVEELQYAAMLDFGLSKLVLGSVPAAYRIVADVLPHSPTATEAARSHMILALLLDARWEGNLGAAAGLVEHHQAYDALRRSMAGEVLSDSLSVWVAVNLIDAYREFGDLFEQRMSWLQKRLERHWRQINRDRPAVVATDAPGDTTLLTWEVDSPQRHHVIKAALRRELLALNSPVEDPVLALLYLSEILDLQAERSRELLGPDGVKDDPEFDEQIEHLLSLMPDLGSLSAQYLESVERVRSGITILASAAEGVNAQLEVLKFLGVPIHVFVEKKLSDEDRRVEQVADGSGFLSEEFEQDLLPHFFGFPIGLETELLELAQAANGAVFPPALLVVGLFEPEALQPGLEDQFRTLVGADPAVIASAGALRSRESPSSSGKSVQLEEVSDGDLRENMEQ